jgi:hypothetical protein
MAILNYSTAVSPERTIGEITSLLVRKGARAITTEFSENGEVSAVSFVMPVGGLPIRFLLPANADGVAAAMLRDEPWNSRRQKTRLDYEASVRHRSKWVAWRILKDWVAAQMALIESNQAEAAQVFMPYAQDGKGQTMFQVWVENNQKRLTAGNGVLHGDLD